MSETMVASMSSNDLVWRINTACRWRAHGENGEDLRHGLSIKNGPLRDWRAKIEIKITQGQKFLVREYAPHTKQGVLSTSMIPLVRSLKTMEAAQTLAEKTCEASKVLVKSHKFFESQGLYWYA